MLNTNLMKYEPFFNPKSILIIGASRNKYTFNGAVVKNLLELQYKGKIYLLHPYAKEILGIKSILMGFGLESIAIHSPNENYPLEQFFNGINTIPYFYKYYVESNK